MRNLSRLTKLTSCRSSLSLPLDTARHADIILQSLQPDPELKPDQISKEFAVSENVLNINFKAKSNRILRVAVNSLLDSVAELLECIDELEDL